MGWELDSFFIELKRRNVFRVAGVYTIVGWLILQVIAVITPALKLPDWVDSFFAVCVIAGFPLSMLFAWAFELTAEGVKRTELVPADESIREHTGRKLEYAIIFGLMAVGGLIIADRLYPEQSNPREASITAPSSQASAKLGPQISEKDSIAVLPFDDLSESGDQAYFSDGIAEEIRNALTRIDGLRVAGRTSSFSFRNSPNTLDEISKSLRVSHILDGSVRKQGDQVRISAALSKNNVVVWNETFNGTLEDVFDLQEQIAQAIAAKLEILMGGERLADTLTNNTASYDLFLRGRDLYHTSIKEEDILRSLKLLEDAVALDPGFAEAWSQLGQSLLVAPANIASLDGPQYVRRAQQASQTAIDLNPTIANPYAVLGSIRSIQKDQLGAMKLFKRALDLDPNNTYALGNTGLVTAMMGQSKTAAEYFEKAVLLEPSRGSYKAYLAVAKRNSEEFEESNILANEATKLGYYIAHDTLAWNAFSQGDGDEAVRQMMNLHRELGDQLSPNLRSEALWDTNSRAYFKNDQDARDYIVVLFKTSLMSDKVKVDGVMTAVLARLGMYEEFFQYVDKARGNTVALMGIWDSTPNSVLLRNHEGFPAFAKQAGMLDYWKTYGWPDKCQPVTEGDNSGDEFTCS
jgi:TolB-like protein